MQCLKCQIEDAAAKHIEDAAANPACDVTEDSGATIILPFSSESALKAAIIEQGFVSRSSRRNAGGSKTSYYTCETCDAKASSRFDDPNWMLSLPTQHQCKRQPAIGVVDHQRGLNPAVLQHIRDLSASGSFSGQQIQEHVRYSDKVTVSIDLIYRIGHALREKLYGSGGDHGHLVRLQAERRVIIPLMYVWVYTVILCRHLGTSLN